MPGIKRPGFGPGGFVRLKRAGTPLVTITSVSPATDRYPMGGALVTITGTNFTVNPDGSQPTVKFGTHLGTNVTVVSPTSITVNTPAQTLTGLYDVSVTIGGFTATLPLAFNYISSFILSITPGFSALPGGINAVVKGLNFVTGSVITIDGVAATSTFVDSQTFFVVIPGPHVLGTVDVTVTEPGGAATTLRGGFQYTLLNRGSDIRRSQPVSIQVQSTLGQPQTATFAIDGQSNKPVTGEKIVLSDPFDSNRVLFAGNILTVEQDYEEQTTQLVWQCSAVDFTFLLNKYRPFGRYITASATEVVKTLVSQFAPDFTANHVQTNLAPVSVYFDGSQDFATCLSQIASTIGGGHWYIDENMDVHFFHIQAPNASALPGVVPGGISLTTTSGLALLQDMELVGSPMSVSTLLVN